ELKSAYLNEYPVETMSQTIGGAGMLALAPVMTGMAHRIGIRDFMAIKALDPSGFGCVITAPLPREDGVPAALAPRWGRIAAHVVAGCRLRRATRRGRDDLPTDAEAVLGKNFQVEHAVGPAETREARAMLRAAAVAIDRARGRLRRRDPDAAVDVW